MQQGEDKREFATVVLAALLHDIGKFFQRARSLSFPEQGRNPEVSSRFIGAFADFFSTVANAQWLETMFLHHHQGRAFQDLTAREISDPHLRTLTYLISTADHLSARERGEHTANYQDYRTTPLVSVFQRVFSQTNRLQ